MAISQTLQNEKLRVMHTPPGMTPDGLYDTDYGKLSAFSGAMISNSLSRSVSERHFMLYRHS